MWVKKRQNIPKKYLPILEELFGIDQSYFGHELTEIDQLEIQKEKLKRDLKPVIKKHEQQFTLREINDLVQVPIYNKEESIIMMLNEAILNNTIVSMNYSDKLCCYKICFRRLTHFKILEFG